MEQIQKTILVTWDFSVVADYALQYAVLLAKSMGNTSIELLHIVDDAKNVENALMRLQVVAEDAKKKYGVLPGVRAVEGDIFTTINKVSAELNCSFVCMGTHGMKGMQKITGSWALKVIEGSECPFIVVQKPPQDDAFVGIVCPVESKKEDKQKISWAVYLNKYIKSKFILYIQKCSDANLKRQVYSNLVHIKSVLDQNNIEYTEVEGLGEDDFSDEMVEYAKSVGANAILVSTSKVLDWADYMLGATEQKIIANKYGIPVFTVLCNAGKLKGFN